MLLREMTRGSPTLVARIRFVRLPPYVMLAAPLLLIATMQLSLAVRSLGQPSESLYGESIIHDQAARILRGEPLYQPLDRPPYSVAAYTPLYYYLAAGLQAAFGPGFWPGRALSLVAGLLAACLVGRLAAGRLGDRRSGVFAALLFLGLGLPGLPSWLASYKEDLLGVALSLGTMTALAGGTTPRRVVVGGLLAGLAVLTKQTLIAAGLAGAVWLWRRDRRTALLFAGAGLTITLGTCLMLELTSRAFLANAVFANVNPPSLDALLPNLAALVGFQAGPLAIAIPFILRQARAGRTADDELLMLFWAASLLPLVALVKVGSGPNHWIELAASTAVLATVALWPTLHDRHAKKESSGRVRAVLGLRANMLAVALMTVFFGLASLRTSAYPPEALASLTERVRSQPGEVLAVPLDIVTLAGRPVLFEPYLFSILSSEGRWNPDPLVARIRAGDVQLVVLDRPLSENGPVYHGFPHWPAPVLAALRETMVLESQQAGRFLYVRRDSTPCVGVVTSYSGPTWPSCPPSAAEDQAGTQRCSPPGTYGTAPAPAATT